MRHTYISRQTQTYNRHRHTTDRQIQETDTQTHRQTYIQTYIHTHINTPIHIHTDDGRDTVILEDFGQVLLAA